VIFVGLELDYPPVAEIAGDLRGLSSFILALVNRRARGMIYKKACLNRFDPDLQDSVRERISRCVHEVLTNYNCFQ
jgi:hypothetical protein